jgi:hypothetical protein
MKEIENRKMKKKKKPEKGPGQRFGPVREISPQPRKETKPVPSVPLPLTDRMDPTSQAGPTGQIFSFLSPEIMPGDQVPAVTPFPLQFLYCLP